MYDAVRAVDGLILYQVALLGLHSRLGGNSLGIFLELCLRTGLNPTVCATETKASTVLQYREGEGNIDLSTLRPCGFCPECRLEGGKLSRGVAGEA